MTIILVFHNYLFWNKYLPLSLKIRYWMKTNIRRLTFSIAAELSRSKYDQNDITDISESSLTYTKKNLF